MTVRVPAKVNLYLGVGTRRRDGYHDLANVFQAVSLYDEVSATPGPGLSVKVVGDTSAGVPADADNLAVRAALALAEATGAVPAARLTITKMIPVAGGMAGGSADAAGALLACNEMWGTGCSRQDLMRIARGVGADVPFMFVGGTALGAGRGDRLTPVLGRGTYNWVLGFAATGLSTAAVYDELDTIRGDAIVPEPAAPDAVMSALRSGDPAALGEVLSNDLEQAAVQLQPALKRTLETGLELGALGAIVSGSGPTCAFLCGTSDDAVALAASLAGAGVCRSTRVAQGPVGGARLVEGGAAR